MLDFEVEVPSTAPTVPGFDTTLPLFIQALDTRIACTSHASIWAPFSHPRESNQPVSAPISRATGTGNCCLHGFPVDTAGHHPDHPHWVPRHQHPWCRAVGYPPKGGQASGHSGYPHKTFVKQLDTPAVRTRAPRNWTLPLPISGTWTTKSAQDPSATGHSLAVHSQT